ncbi:MAG: esterase, partial [Pseudomonas sp.]
MSIWLQQPDLAALNALSPNTLVGLLDIRFESFDEESLTASMVVDARTHQPY